MKTGIELIAEERKEQIEKHGRTLDQDKHLNNRRQLRYAAVALIGDRHFISPTPDGWDEKIWDKMRRKGLLERLTIAGALIAAEIDRLQVETTTAPDQGADDVQSKSQVS